MIGDTRTTKRIEYWKTLGSKERPWITYDIVPKTVRENSFYFDEFVQYIKNEGFNFKIIETTERIIDEK